METQTILITGAASALAGKLAQQLAPRYSLVGVDLHPEPHGTFPGTYYQHEYTKRPFTDVFRRHKIDTILHLGRIKPTQMVGNRYRYQQNVGGTRAILREGYQRGVRHFVVISTHQVYGPSKDNYLYLQEDESLRAVATVPDLADAVELDHEACEFLWRTRDVTTTVLRPVALIGKHVEGVLMSALKMPVAPVLFGFDPLMQFLHEDDFTRAVELTITKPQSGVFNLAGEGIIQYSEALRLAGSQPLPFLASCFPLLVRAIGYRLPQSFLNYIKYPIVVDDTKFRHSYAFTPQLTLNDALANLRAV